MAPTTTSPTDRHCEKQQHGHHNRQSSGSSPNAHHQHQQKHGHHQQHAHHHQHSSSGTMSPSGPVAPYPPISHPYLRMRSDSMESTGSTRGAFYQGHLPAHPAAPSPFHLVPPDLTGGTGTAPTGATANRRGSGHRSKRRPSATKPKSSKTEKRQTREDSSTPSSMAELANMAVASIESPVSPGGKNRRSPVEEPDAVPLSPGKQRATVTAAPSTKTSMTQRASSHNKALPQQSQQHHQRRLSGRLPPMETIHDESTSSHPDDPNGTLTESPRHSRLLAYSRAGRLPNVTTASTLGTESLPLPQSKERECLRLSEVSVESGDSLRISLMGMDLLEDNIHTSNDNRNSNKSNVGPPASTGPTPVPPRGHPIEEHQQQEIAMFSSMIHADYGATAAAAAADDKRGSVLKTGGFPGRNKVPSTDEPDFHSDEDAVDKVKEEGEEDTTFDSNYNEKDGQPNTLYDRIIYMLDPTPWLSQNVQFEDDGTPHFDDSAVWTLAGLVRHCFFNPIMPEFTSLQQFNWAILIGIAMGFYTAIWKTIIETGLDFMWETLPAFLLRLGFFTDLDGSFPLYHYMWICPAIFGGILSYVFVVLPTKIPDQNDWIDSVHSRGVQDYRTFYTLFFLSTCGMLSGLSLGPELPLVLTAGMVGSWLGLICKQSMLQARVLNLTAASAAVGGFFGFPMAGALFVLEIPHRMGLQYFEALSPATISSIVAVLVNRLVTGNDVTGYYSYPFLSSTLPSEIFTSAIVYGFYGAGVGVAYATGAKKFKMWVHDLFHAPHENECHQKTEPAELQEEDPVVNGGGESHLAAVDEKKPLIVKEAPPLQHVASTNDLKAKCQGVWSWVISKTAIANEAHRAAVSGVLAGVACGVVGIFVPHTLFWGEAQLQNLIDKGRTPLPIFGQGDEPTAALTALGYCMIDPQDPDAVEEGFSIACSVLISVAKTVVIGISLGTGIIGGHFWGPLFVGCSASHFLNDVVTWFSERVGFGGVLAEHPCVVILCTMGSAHVVTFRAHTAIMLILTLTISAFDPEGENSSGASFKVAGDYSAVFPLLVVSVFISLMVSRRFVFYKTQRCRGDIMAVPEVLCEPGMEGRPMVVDYDYSNGDGDGDGEDLSFSSKGDDSADHPAEHGGGATVDVGVPMPPMPAKNTTATTSVRTAQESITQSDIEKAFEQEQAGRRLRDNASSPPETEKNGIPPSHDLFAAPSGDASTAATSVSTTLQNPSFSSARLDELLSKPMETEAAPPPKTPPPSTRRRLHRRSMSAPVQPAEIPRGSSLERNNEKDKIRFENLGGSTVGNRERSNSRGNLVRVTSFGEVQDHQPSLLDQARMRSASSSAESRHRRVPSLPSGRGNGNAVGTISLPPEDAGALSITDIEKSFNQMVNKQVLGAKIDAANSGYDS